MAAGDIRSGDDYFNHELMESNHNKTCQVILQTKSSQSYELGHALFGTSSQAMFCNHSSMCLYARQTTIVHRPGSHSESSATPHRSLSSPSRSALQALRLSSTHMEIFTRSACMNARRSGHYTPINRLYLVTNTKRPGLVTSYAALITSATLALVLQTRRQGLDDSVRPSCGTIRTRDRPLKCDEVGYVCIFLLKKSWRRKVLYITHVLRCLEASMSASRSHVRGRGEQHPTKVWMGYWCWRGV